MSVEADDLERRRERGRHERRRGARRLGSGLSPRRGRRYCQRTGRGETDRFVIHEHLRLQRKFSRLGDIVDANVRWRREAAGKLPDERLEVRRLEMEVERRLIGPLFEEQVFVAVGQLLVERVRDAAGLLF